MTDPKQFTPKTLPERIALINRLVARMRELCDAIDQDVTHNPDPEHMYSDEMLARLFAKAVPGILAEWSGAAYELGMAIVLIPETVTAIEHPAMGGAGPVDPKDIN